MEQKPYLFSIRVYYRKNAGVHSEMASTQIYSASI